MRLKELLELTLNDLETNNENRSNEDEEFKEEIARFPPPPLNHNCLKRVLEEYKIFDDE